MDIFATPPPATRPPRVTQTQFIGAIWGGTTISFIFLSIRLYSRLSGPRRLFWDDILVIFAWFLALLSAITWQVVANYLYDFVHLTSGLLWPPPTDFIAHTERYYVGQLVVLIFFYTSLYTVKLSFLLFFKRLGHNVYRQKYIWWPVLIFTLATYFVCIGDIQYKCIIRPFTEIAASCSTAENVQFTLVTLKFNCAMDVLTDFLIMIIPFTLLWNVQMRWEKKLAFLGIFSLVIITMVFAIVRVTMISSLTGQPDTTWLYFWSSIEQCIAIIVACLSAFPRLFTQSAHVKKPVFSPSDTYRSMMKRIKSRRHNATIAEISNITDISFTYARTPDDEAGRFSNPSEPRSSSQHITIPKTAMM